MCRPQKLLDADAFGGYPEPAKIADNGFRSPCSLDAAQFVAFRDKLVGEIDPKSDSLRFYFLGNHWRRRVEHVGAHPSYDPDGFMEV